MSADLLRRAATILRERAEAATPGPWEVALEADETTPARLRRKSTSARIGHPWHVCVDGQYWDDAAGHNNADAAYIATVHPSVGLALADWLDGLADSHGPGGIEELVLHPEEACEVCEDGGHEVEVCAACYPMWDGMEARQVYPCAEVKRALPLARLIVGEPS